MEGTLMPLNFTPATSVNKDQKHGLAVTFKGLDMKPARGAIQKCAEKLRGIRKNLMWSFLIPRA
jgi:hypothetical protein